MKAKNVKISIEQLVSMLMSWNFGAQPTSIQSKTKPKLLKAGTDRFGIVTKISYIGGMVGYCYENSVNNQREREEKIANFMAEELWNGNGKRISLALSKHVEKGTFYLTYKYQQTFKTQYLDKDNNPIPYEVIKQYFPKSNSNSQGLEKPINHRELSLENLRKFKFKGTTYEVVS